VSILNRGRRDGENNLASARGPQPAQTTRYSFIKILTGSDLSRRRLPIMSAASPRAGPVVWLTGCAHGDEVGGMVVIQEIFRRLRKQPLLRGELHAFPLMNPMGFEVSSRQVSMTDEDLNRCFPGNRQGTLAQRIADTIFTEIVRREPTLVLDLHNDWRSSIPYAVIDPQPGPSHRDAYSLAKNFARQTGLLPVQESRRAPEATVLQRALSGALLARHVPALTLELGEAYVVNETNVNYGLGAVWNVLSDLGMVLPAERRFEYPVPAQFRRRFLTYSDQHVSSTSGVIRFLVKAGEVVTPGRPLAKIYNAFGKPLETITARNTGIVLGHADSSAAYPGAPVVAFGLLPERPAEKPPESSTARAAAPPMAAPPPPAAAPRAAPTRTENAET